MADTLVGAILDGRYQVIEAIAEGAMGAVYRGERLKLGRAVAIKIMHEELPDELASRQRFEREAKLMARLEHPHCVSVVDFGVHDDKPFLVMELVRGTSLLDLMAHGRLEQPRIAEIMRQILSGLGHAHELGIVHRDIKPANIMVTEKTGLGEQVRILDFGLARLTDTGTKLTTGIVVGTPNYMAPEQCTGGAVDARTDLYAVGVLLFEMLTGKKPFVADDPLVVVRKHLQEPPPKLADVTPGDYGDFETIVARALSKQPGDRYASAAEMSVAIEAIARAARVATESGRVEMTATPSGWNLPADSAPSATRAPSAPIDRAPSAPIVETSAPVIARPPRPFTRKQLAIGGGGVLAVLVVGLIASQTGGSPVPADAAPIAQAIADAPPTDPMPALVARIRELVAAGDKDTALEVALRARRQFPDDGTLAYLTGRIYFSKLYWTDGIKNFRDAIRIEPNYRTDPELIKTVLRGFITTPSTDDRIEEFLREDLGAEFRPYLEDTAKNHPNATIRARAAAELRRLH